jgi:hypothetical protein
MTGNVITLSATVDGGNILSTIDCGHGWEITQVRVPYESLSLLSPSYNGKKVVFTPDYRSISIVDMESGKIQNIQFFSEKYRISAILQSPDLQAVLVIFPGTLYQIYLVTGKVTKKITTLYPITAASTVPGRPNDAIFGYDTGFVEIKEIFGHIVRWRGQVPGSVQSVLAVEDRNDLIIYVQTRNGNFFALNTHSNLPVYTKKIGLKKTALSADQILLLSDQSGNLELWNIETDFKIAKYNIGRTVSGIFSYQNKFYVCLDDSSIYILNPRTLELIAPPIVPPPEPIPTLSLNIPHTSSLIPYLGEILPIPQLACSDFFSPGRFTISDSIVLPSPISLPSLNPVSPHISSFGLFFGVGLPIPVKISPDIFAPGQFTIKETELLPETIALPPPNPDSPHTSSLNPNLEVSLPIPVKLCLDIFEPGQFTISGSIVLPSPISLPSLNPVSPHISSFGPFFGVGLPNPVKPCSDIFEPGQFTISDSIVLPRPISLPSLNPISPHISSFGLFFGIGLPIPVKISPDIFTPSQFTIKETELLPETIALPPPNPDSPHTSSLNPNLEVSLPIPVKLCSDIFEPGQFTISGSIVLPSPILLPSLNPVSPHISSFGLFFDIGLPIPMKVCSDIFVPGQFTIKETERLPETLTLPPLNPNSLHTSSLNPTLEIGIPFPVQVRTDIFAPGTFIMLDPKLGLPKLTTLSSPLHTAAHLGFDLLDGCIKINIITSDTIQPFFDLKEITDVFIPVDVQSEYTIDFKNPSGDVVNIVLIEGITDEKPYLIFNLSDDFCLQKTVVPKKDFIVVTAADNRPTPDEQIQGGGDITNWAGYQWYIFSFKDNTVYTLETPLGQFIIWEPAILTPFFVGGAKIKDLPVTIDTLIYSEFPDLIIPGILHNWTVQIYHVDVGTRSFTDFNPWNISYGCLSLIQEFKGKIGKFTIITKNQTKQTSFTYVLIVIPFLLIEFVIDGPFISFDRAHNSVQVRIKGPKHVLGAKRQHTYFVKDLNLNPESLSKITVWYTDNESIDLSLVPPLLRYSIGTISPEPVGHLHQMKKHWITPTKLFPLSVAIYIPHYLKYKTFLLQLTSDSADSIIQRHKRFTSDFYGDYVIRKYSLDVFRDAIELFSPFSTLHFNIISDNKGNISRGEFLSLSSWWVYNLTLSSNKVEWFEKSLIPHKSRLSLTDNNGKYISHLPLVIPMKGSCTIFHRGLPSQYGLKIKALLDGDTLSSLETDWIDHSDPYSSAHRMLRIFDPEEVTKLLSSSEEEKIVPAQIHTFCLQNYETALNLLEPSDYSSKLLEAYCRKKLQRNPDLTSLIQEFPNEREINTLFAADIFLKNKLQASMILNMTPPLTHLNGLNSIIELDARCELLQKGFGNISNLYKMAVIILSEYYFIQPLWKIVADLEKQMKGERILLSSLNRIYTKHFIWFKEYQNSIRTIFEMINQ